MEHFNSYSANPVSKHMGGRGRGGAAAHRSHRREFQGWLRVATRDGGNSQEAQQTPPGRNPRKKLPLLVSKSSDYQWGMETKGISRVLVGLKIPLSGVI